eukprot:11186038-Alexandrium_andersonii.AAC.1
MARAALSRAALSGEGVRMRRHARDTIAMLLTWKPRRCSFEFSAGVGGCTFASRAFVGAGVVQTALAMVAPKSRCWSNGAIDPVHSCSP